MNEKVYIPTMSLNKINLWKKYKSTSIWKYIRKHINLKLQEI